MFSSAGGRRLVLIQQAEAAECGLACLAMIAGYHGHLTDLAALRRRYPTSLRGATLKTLMAIAADLNFSARAVRCELEELGGLRTPAILHWGMNHFVVLKRVRGDTVELHDPASGYRRVSKAVVSDLFTGIALELTPTTAFERKAETQPFPLRALVRISPQNVRALVQAVVLSVLIEGFVLATPLYLQTVVDRVLIGGGTDLLGVLALAFALVLLFHVIASAMRALILQFVTITLSFELKMSVFRHLMRLPANWFVKRNLGDIQNRFHSLDPIQQFVASGAITTLFDGVFAVLLFFAMLFVAPLLAATVLLAFAIYFAGRLLLLAIMREAMSTHLAAQAREESRFLETLRAIRTIKVAGGELRRESLQQNAMARSLNAAMKVGNINVGASALQQLIGSGAAILVIFLGARAVLAGQLTIGILTAFLAYQAQFLLRATAFADQLIQLRLLRVHLERLKDIALSPIEQRVPGGYASELEGEIEFRSVSFAYSPNEPAALKNVSFAIKRGECVGVAGPSGAGKSTLLNLIAGIHPATAGQILIDGRLIQNWDHAALRAQVASIAQDDTLLHGSLADNIAFFDEAIDMERVVACARMANIDAAISAMPMRYETLVGDMGSTLSGGQLQRVLLARALYRAPRLLILDEATAHLDLENERAIMSVLAAHKITCIFVAHRPEALRFASRILALSIEGHLLDECELRALHAEGSRA